MIYLTGALNQDTREFIGSGVPWLGVMDTPRSRYSFDRSWSWAADNGCFSKRPWDESEWWSWLEGLDRSALFATCPDVVGDWLATQRRWSTYSAEMRRVGFRVAYVLQDGAPDFPFEADAVFVGGTDNYKLSADAQRLVRKAKALGKWAHMGRVNSDRRIWTAWSWGCDSVDGTMLAFGADYNLGRLRRCFDPAQGQLVGPGAARSATPGCR